MKKLSAILICSSLLCTLTSCSNPKKEKSSSAIQNETSTNANTVEGEKKENIVLTMVVEGIQPEFYLDEVEAFNAADNGCQIVLKKYRKSDNPDGYSIAYSYTTEEHLAIDMEVLQDVMNTDEIDIICNGSFVNPAYYELLKEKGAFADLYTFMENDSEVNTATLNSHALSVLETDDALYGMPAFFEIHTLSGDKKYVGDKENWTVDDFIGHWEKMPEGSTISGSREAENVYDELLRGNLQAFVDYDNAQAHFDSPEFRRILEFCNTFPSVNGQKGDYNYELPNFVSEHLLTGISSSLCFGGDRTLVGYPSSDGSGAYFTSAAMSYSISAKSSPEKQQAAWQFIRTFFTKEKQLEDVIESYTYPELYGDEPVWSSEFGLCMNNEAFDEMARNVTSEKYRQPEGYYVDKGEPYEPSFPTIEDVEELKRYIETVNRWEERLDDFLWEIINEEVLAYFAGENSLDQTVDLIQNRAQIWVSEQS